MRLVMGRRYLRYVKQALIVYVIVSVIAFISLYNQNDDLSGRGASILGKLFEANKLLNGSRATGHVSEDLFPRSQHALAQIDDTGTGEDVNKTIRTEKITFQGKDETGKCVLTGSFRENLNKLKAINFVNSNFWMQKHGFDKDPEKRSTSFPVLVTGASKEYYGVVQGLIKTVHEVLVPKYPTLKLIVYDLNFSPDQNKQMAKYCQCEVRRLPYDDLPVHVRNFQSYAFKPIIVKTVFNEYGHVWWVDSSIRFITDNLTRAQTYLEETGALFFTYSPTLNVALHTHMDTFRHFEEDPCAYMYLGEIEAGNVAFINNEAGNVIVERWAACAMDLTCARPNGAIKSCRVHRNMDQSLIGNCHRFDQSSLSIILRRLYHQRNDYPFVENPIRIIQVRRGERVSYFPRT